MTKDLKRSMQKQGRDGKSLMKVANGKQTRHKNARQNILQSLTKIVNQNCHEFVMLNKNATFKNLDRKLLEKMKDITNQGFVCFLLLNIIRYL